MVHSLTAEKRIKIVSLGLGERKTGENGSFSHRAAESRAAGMRFHVGVKSSHCLSNPFGGRLFHPKPPLFGRESEESELHFCRTTVLR